MAWVGQAWNLTLAGTLRGIAPSMNLSGRGFDNPGPWTVHIYVVEYLALNEGEVSPLFGGKGVRETKDLTEVLHHLAGGGGLGGP